jgi:hypothetical protein
MKAAARMSAKAKTMMKMKSRMKQIPFNVYLPWGESIAQ